MKLDFFFARKPRRHWERKEPRLWPETPPLEQTTDFSPASRHPVPATASGSGPRQSRRMSPRQMAQWAREMYLGGALGQQDYLAAIPAELHPDYDRTVGALTGQPAHPDLPRDMIREWEEKVAFLRRHHDGHDDSLRQAERILALLRKPKR